MAAATGQSPSRSGELRRITETMKAQIRLEDDEVPLTQRETQVLRRPGVGSEQ